jgi:hypothetical protein
MRVNTATCIRHGGEETARVFVRKPEDVRPLGKPGCRWEDNIKMD